MAGRGAAVAGPVFREIADKLNALYVDKPEAPGYAAILKKDSSGFYYAGETGDMKFLLNKMRMGFRDSAENSEWGSVYASSDLTPVVNSRQAGSQVMPNVKGMGLKDALYMLEGMKLSVVSKGKGKVINQFPEPGSAYQKNQQVLIELN